MVRRPSKVRVDFATRSIHGLDVSTETIGRSVFLATQMVDCPQPYSPYAEAERTASINSRSSPSKSLELLNCRLTARPIRATTGGSRFLATFLRTDVAPLPGFLPLRQILYHNCSEIVCEENAQSGWPNPRPPRGRRRLAPARSLHALAATKVPRLAPSIFHRRGLDQTRIRSEKPGGRRAASERLP